MNPDAIRGAAARLFPKNATWPHSLLVTAVFAEREIMAAYIRAEGIMHSPPLDSDVEALAGVAVALAAIEAVKFDLSRASPGYVQWECVMLLHNLGVPDSERAAGAFVRSLPQLARTMGMASVITPTHYEVCRQYRMAFESAAYRLNRSDATRMAVLKLVHAIQGGAQTETASDASLRWTVGVDQIHKFITSAVARTPLDTLISELEVDEEAVP